MAKEEGASPTTTKVEVKKRIEQYRQNWLRYLRGILGRDHPATRTPAGNRPHPTTMLDPFCLLHTILTSPDVRWREFQQNEKTKRMKKKIQNKLGTYLAVSAGVGCVASVAEGAIVVVDLSGLSTSVGSVFELPVDGGDMVKDFEFYATNFGTLNGFPHEGGGQFYIGPDPDRVFGGFSPTETAYFPESNASFVTWFHVDGGAGGGFSVGENWVAFSDSSGKYGWLSFTLTSLVGNNANPISSFGHYVYDDASTEPSDAITLQAAVAAAAIPEPSSLVLLALGATGLLARRQRKQAA